jgi:predicted dehydrogenase/threonine dehydrogenase-like Zn-dependent dehydrogenase
MKQLTQNLRTGKLSVDEVPTPGVPSGYVLVQTAYSLISAGTERTKIETGRKSLIGKAMARPDQVRQVVLSAKQNGLKVTFEKVRTRLDARSPLGYSAAGIVIAVGAGISEYRVGDKVACGGANAAHAEVICVPKNLCVPIPSSVSLDAAAFATVGAISLQGIRQADVRLGDVAVVIGLGLIGQLTVQMLKAAGCIVIGLDLDGERCSLAYSLGADAVAGNESSLKSSLDQFTTFGADAVIITAGTSSNRPVELAGEIARDKGRVIIVGAVGMTVPREPYYQKELDLRLSRSYGPGRYDPSYEENGIDYPIGYVRWTERRNMGAFLGLLLEEKINLSRLITHRFKLEDAEAAYALVRGASNEQYLGVLFEYALSSIKVMSRVEINPTKEDPNGKVGVGVVGAGNFAQSMLLPHLKKYKYVSLIGVTTLYPIESRDVAERFGFEYIASTSDEILSDPKVKGVIIATRHNTHASLVVQALKAGKAVHVEKPLAMKPEELDEILEVYKNQNQAYPFLMVGFNRRFAPMVRSMKSFFEQRKEPLAMIYRINAGYLPLDHWTQDIEVGGGRIVGEVCHFIDLMQFFSCSPVKTVFAQALPNAGKYLDDNVAVNLAFCDGSVSTIFYTANGDKALRKEYIEIFGEGKVAILDDYQKLNLISNGKQKIITDGRGDKGHRQEMIEWAEAIQKGAKEPVPFEESLLATQATFAVLESLRTGRVINLNYL